MIYVCFEGIKMIALLLRWRGETLAEIQSTLKKEILEKYYPNIDLTIPLIPILPKVP